MDSLLSAYVDEQRAANEDARRRSAPHAGAASAAQIRRGRLYARDGRFRPILAPEAYDEEVATILGPVRSRMFPVPNPLGTIVHFHGGGWALGSVYEQDGLMSQMARASRSVVASIDYPLAPETALPKALDVVSAALHAIVARNASGRVCVIGESAGAHVALMGLIRLRAHPELIKQVRAMSLSYGIYDLSMTPSQRAWGDGFLGLSTPWLEWFYAQTLPGHSRDQRSDPALSPLYADLRGLPSAIISVGQLDPLLDDSLFLFQRWRAAGNDGILHVYPEAPHGFNHADTAMARCCNERIATFLRDSLAAASDVLICCSRAGTDSGYS